MVIKFSTYIGYVKETWTGNYFQTSYSLFVYTKFMDLKYFYQTLIILFNINHLFAHC